MNDEQLQKSAFYYGRNSEKLRHINAETDEETYRKYRELCAVLWLELKENGATDGVKLKAEYVAYEQAGRDSVGEY